MKEVYALCSAYVDAERAAKRLREELLTEALSSGETHLFSLNMRAVHMIARERDKKPARR